VREMRRHVIERSGWRCVLDVELLEGETRVTVSATGPGLSGADADAMAAEIEAAFQTYIAREGPLVVVDGDTGAVAVANDNVVARFVPPPQKRRTE